MLSLYLLEAFEKDPELRALVVKTFDVTDELIDMWLAEDAKPHPSIREQIVDFCEQRVHLLVPA